MDFQTILIISVSFLILLIIILIIVLWNVFFQLHKIEDKINFDSEIIQDLMNELNNFFIKK